MPQDGRGGVCPGERPLRSLCPAGERGFATYGGVAKAPSPDDEGSRAAGALRTGPGVTTSQVPAGESHIDKRAEAQHGNCRADGDHEADSDHGASIAVRPSRARYARVAVRRALPAGSPVTTLRM